MKDYKRAFIMIVAGLISWVVAILVSYLCHEAPANSIMECMYGLCTGMFGIIGTFMSVFAIYLFWETTGKKEIDNIN